MNLSLLLSLIGMLGFVLKRKNIIMLTRIKIRLWFIGFLVLIDWFVFNDIIRQMYAIYIIAITGIKSAITLWVEFYRPRGNIGMEYKWCI